MKALIQTLFFFLLTTQIYFAQSVLTWTTNGPFGPTFSDIVIDYDGTVFAQSDSGLYRSMDNGATWLQLLEPKQNTGGVTVGLASVLVGADSLLLRSTDAGNTWDTLLIITRDRPWIGRHITSVDLAPITGVILAGGGSVECYSGKCPCGFEGILFRSSDGGATWDTSDVHAYMYITKMFENGLAFGATTTNGGWDTVLGCNRDTVWRSLDGGENWTRSWSRGEGIVDVEVNGLNEVFLAYRDSVFFSSDTGSSWTPINGVPSWISSIAFNANDDIFIATRDLGVFRNYLQVNNGLTNLNTTCIAVSPEGYVFAGTAGGGIFRTTETTVGIAGEEYLVLTSSLAQNFPNPFNPSTKIKYSVPQTSQVQIKVFDVLGNEIETLVNEEKPAGTYELTWNAANHPSGVYFYQIKAGEFISTKKMILLK